MNKFELTCEYCGKIWQLLETPRYKVYCIVCGDSRIRVDNIAETKIDYYRGSSKFKEEDEYDN